MLYDGTGGTSWQAQDTTGGLCVYGPSIPVRAVSAASGHVAFHGSYSAPAWPVPPSNPPKPKPSGPVICRDASGRIIAMLEPGLEPAP